jgi:hypothetical protein
MSRAECGCIYYDVARPYLCPRHRREAGDGGPPPKVSVAIRAHNVDLETAWRTIAWWEQTCEYWREEAQKGYALRDSLDARDARTRADECERIAQECEATMMPAGWVDAYRPGLAVAARIAREGQRAGIPVEREDRAQQIEGDPETYFAEAAERAREQIRRDEERRA